MGISFEYKEQSVEQAHGSNAFMTDNDFEDKKSLKAAIKEVFKHYQCPDCGGHRMTGSGVIVEFGKVKFFQEVEKKGLLGRKWVTQHDRDVYRLYNIYLESSGFLSSAGYIRCKSCKWEQKGGKGIKWMSINDIMNG